MSILVTGSAGMIGSCVVKGLISNGHKVVGIDRKKTQWDHKDFEQYIVDLGDKGALHRIFETERPDKVIHLAALAHTAGETDLSFERYKHINVECAKNVFLEAEVHHCPILFISTVDAIGMVRGLITSEVCLNPISNYGKSKAMAEDELKHISSSWNIYRFSPVYTPEIKRDIEKRYYLKYPNWAYRIGRGEKFEVLNIVKAVESMVEWVDKKVDNTIHIIKDPQLLDINELIAQEKRNGRANHVLWFPRWAVLCGYYCLRLIFGKSNKTYLVFKALWPFRSK